MPYMIRGWPPPPTPKGLVAPTTGPLCDGGVGWARPPPVVWCGWVWGVHVFKVEFQKVLHELRSQRC